MFHLERFLDAHAMSLVGGIPAAVYTQDDDLGALTSKAADGA
jgi:hypothetical protein